MDELCVVLESQHSFHRDRYRTRQTAVADGGSEVRSSEYDLSIVASSVGISDRVVRTCRKCGTGNCRFLCSATSRNTVTSWAKMNLKRLERTASCSGVTLSLDLCWRLKQMNRSPIQRQRIFTMRFTERVLWELSQAS